MKLRPFVFLFLCTLSLISQEKEYYSTFVNVNKYIDGTLVTPYSDQKVPLVIFIMDAGVINRDGNDHMSKGDTFKKLSYILAKKGIASFRYDKRLFKLDRLGIKEHEILFDHFVLDVRSIINYFTKNDNYTKIIIAGHGQGSLIGMLAVTEQVKGFISIAGNAQSIDDVIIEQLSKQAPGLDKSAALAFRDLKENGRAFTYDPALESIFRINLQPFMKSWIQHTPSELIQELTIPIMIIHGDKDIQVELSEAEKLKDKAPEATFLVIPKMNHILRKIEGGRLENYKSYNESNREIMPALIDGITTFVNTPASDQDIIKN